MLLLSISKIPPSSQITLWPSLQACWANFDFSNRPSYKLYLCSWSYTTRGLPALAMQLLPHPQRMLQSHSVACCESLSNLVFMSELLWVFCIEDRSNVMIPFTFQLWKTLHIGDIHRDQRHFLFARMTAALGVNNRLNETLEMTVKLQSLFWRLWIKPLFTCGWWLEMKLKYWPVWRGVYVDFGGQSIELVWVTEH
jgi:hypothetical protein